MNERALAGESDDIAILPRNFLMRRSGLAVFVAVSVVSLWITAGALSKSYLIGRLAFPVTHGDVNYLIAGIRRLLYIEINGFWAEIPHLYREPLHAPLSSYQAAVAFYLFGFHDWAPYVSSIVYLWIFFAFCAVLLRGLPAAAVIAVLIALTGMPMLYSSIFEFEPEVPCGLFTALGVLLTLRVPLLERAAARRAIAGLCFGLGFLAKPSSFAFVPLIVCATLGVTFIRDVLLDGKLREFPTAVQYGVLQLILSLWLPALYIIPNFHEFSDYFYRAMFDPATIKMFAGDYSLRENLLYYLTGSGGEYMFGNFLWAYVGVIAVGLAAASKRGDRRYIGEQIALLIMAIILWLPPTLALSKNTLFALPFGFLLAFMLVMSIRSIYETIGDLKGMAIVWLLGGLLVVSAISFTGGLPNTPGFDWYAPGAHVVHEKWPEAMERLRTVMLKNSPNYHGRSVYETNSGYFFGPVLWYFFLKRDPTLDWTFYDPLWGDMDPQHHMDFILKSKDDFVIAGENGNGLTYGPSLYAGASAAENAVLAALTKDPDYIALDRFYGPSGGMITVFQRRTAFAGWRPLGGLHQENNDANEPWISDSTISHLGAYAPVAIGADLTIVASGPAGERCDVILNQGRIANLNFDSVGKASVTQTLDLRLGENDIVFRCPLKDPLTFERLLLARKIGGNV